MNIFSNVGITELILILLLALLVVGPERLPELARQLGKTLRDLRKAYDNLTRDLGPELLSMQKTTQELRESVDSIRSIPQDMVKQVVKAADLDDTIEELKDVKDSVGQVGQTLSEAGKVIKSPVSAAASAARSTLMPDKTTGQKEAETAPKEPPPAVEPEAVPPLPEQDSVPPSESVEAGKVEQASEVEGPQAARAGEAAEVPEAAAGVATQTDAHPSNTEPDMPTIEGAAVHPTPDASPSDDIAQEAAIAQGPEERDRPAADSEPAEQAHE